MSLIGLLSACIALSYSKPGRYAEFDLDDDGVIRVRRRGVQWEERGWCGFGQCANKLIYHARASASTEGMSRCFVDGPSECGVVLSNLKPGRFAEHNPRDDTFLEMYQSGQKFKDRWVITMYTKCYLNSVQSGRAGISMGRKGVLRVGILRGQYHTVDSCSCCDWRHVSVSFVDRSSECGAGLSYPKPGRYVEHPPPRCWSFWSTEAEGGWEGRCSITPQEQLLVSCSCLNPRKTLLGISLIGLFSERQYSGARSQGDTLSTIPPCGWVHGIYHSGWKFKDRWGMGMNTT